MSNSNIGTASINPSNGGAFAFALRPSRPSHDDRVRARANKLLTDFIPANTQFVVMHPNGNTVWQATLVHIDIGIIRSRLEQARQYIQRREGQIGWVRFHKNINLQGWEFFFGCRRSKEKIREFLEMVDEMEQVARRQVDEQEAMESGNI